VVRAGLVTLAVLALAAQPAFAQGKTKTAPSTAVIAALEMCETFARGEEKALDDAVEAGWDAYDQESESPFVKSYAASYEIAGFGWADLFALVETYPGTLFGYCRIDIADPRGDGKAAIEAIAGLDRYEGEVLDEDGRTLCQPCR
jgi:predicted TIM-barrel fold metal-dependent hydrolase